MDRDNACADQQKEKKMKTKESFNLWDVSSSFADNMKAKKLLINEI